MKVYRIPLELINKENVQRVDLDTPKSNEHCDVVEKQDLIDAQEKLKKLVEHFDNELGVEFPAYSYLDWVDWTELKKRMGITCWNLE